MSDLEANSDFNYKSKLYLSSDVKCLHCGQRFKPSRQDDLFCCVGCKHVYYYIQSSSLGYYYEIKEQFQSEKVSDQPQPVSVESIIPKDYFEDPEFQKQFCQKDGNHTIVRLTIPDLTCYACVWLCEKALHRELPEAKVQINLSDKCAELWVKDPSIEVGQAVKVLHSIGLRVLPGSDQELLKQRRVSRIRLGIAILCTINIMSFAFAEYVDLPVFVGSQSSLSFEWRQIFRWIQGVLFVPVIFFSALPFFRSAYSSVITHQMNIDLPIAMSLVMTSTYSYYSLFFQGPIYFDSLAMGVSLLLVGRKFLELHVQKAMNQIRSSWMQVEEWLRIESEDGTTRPVNIHSVKIGDRLRILPGEIVTLSGTIVEGGSFFSTERINGEMKSVYWQKGDQVLEQAICLDSVITIEVHQEGSSSFIQRSQRLIEKLQSEKANWARKFERIASYFFLGVCLSALLVLMVFHFNQEGIHRALAIVLIACPCAFGLAIPLSFASSMAMAIRAGLVFRSQHAFELLSKANCFVFDKTGTLTLGKFRLTEVSENFLLKKASQKDENFHAVLSEISKRSLHPLMQTIQEFYKHHANITLKMQIQSFRSEESLGQGVVANYLCDEWRIGNRKFCFSEMNKSLEVEISDQHGFYIFKNNEFFAFISFLDEIDSGSCSLFNYLRSIKAETYLLSGDSSSNVEDLSQELGIQILAKGCTPEEKMHQLQTLLSRSTTVMIGNGVNDSYALAKSHVGVAVVNSSELAKRSADVVLNHKGIVSLIHAIRISKLSRRKIISACLFASLYNLAGIALAAGGFIQPLLAALLMPLSSLLIVWISSQAYENIFLDV